MKSILLYLILVNWLVSIFACKSDNYPVIKSKEVLIPIVEDDTIRCDQVLIENCFLFATKSEVYNKIGVPDSIDVSIDSMDWPSRKITTFLYGESELHFESTERLTGAVLRDSSISVLEQKIKVGDSIHRLAAAYPNSFNNLNNKKYTTVSLPFKNCRNLNSQENPTGFDGYVFFEYNDQLIIDKIGIYFLE